MRSIGKVVGGAPGPNAGSQFAPAPVERAPRHSELDDEAGPVDDRQHQLFGTNRDPVVDDVLAAVSASHSQAAQGVERAQPRAEQECRSRGDGRERINGTP